MIRKPYAVPIPYQDPLTLYAGYKAAYGVGRHAVILHSARHRPEGRYSFIGLSPWRLISVQNGCISDSQVSTPICDVNPWDYVERAVFSHVQETDPSLPPFQGGACGYFGYEMQHHLEKIRRPEGVSGVPDLWIGFYDTVISFDHDLQKAWVVTCGNLRGQDSEADDQRRAHDFADCLIALAAQQSAVSASQMPTFPQIHSYLPRDEYEKKVEQILEYIRAGDVYQVNLSRVLEGEWMVNTSQLLEASFSLYRQLCAQNPAPFSAYIEGEDFAVVSCSPERFLRVQDGVAETKPIKGTCPRSNDPVEDNRLRAELQACPKNHAENLMIVDLLRNDLSKVCSDVRVPALMAVESYATVHHLVSTVTGHLKKGETALSALRACFPGGSITGAPKCRAMEIISELEERERGVYCGAIGYIGFDGTMDTNIVIRTVAMTKERVRIQVGGGIVADSSPASEFEETVTKAKALVTALSS